MVLSYVLYKNAIVDLCYYFYICINIKINLFLKTAFNSKKKVLSIVRERCFLWLLKTPFTNRGYLLNFII